jgi:hypothetical protein
MSEQERKEKALQLFEKLQNLMVNLYSRWQDEKDYEDINDYGVNIKKYVVEIGGEFIKMNKRPFGFVYKLENAIYQVIVRSSRYEYKRIA